MAHLVDTDVLIDAAKDYPGAVAFLENLPNWSISVCTAMELIVGARNPPEADELDELFARVTLLPLTPGIGERASATQTTRAY